ncbi:MAG: ABC transporter substrate-binding protein [Candidatus Thorarchaeota archaeon]|nr:ABC transporter substrate-binding protein [Candidatus Thorarchaeota archaeon]
MENKSGASLVLIVIVVASVVTVAVWTTPPPPDIRIGYLSKDLHQLALRVALQKGWFTEAGLRVETVEFGNGAYEMDGFAAGQIDIGYLGVAPALTKSINQNINITVLAAANLEGSAIMVHKGEYDAGRITSIHDLIGKTVFHPGPSTVQNFLLRLALNQSGHSIEDLTLEQARPQDMAISLTPEKPAYVAWEPFPAFGERDQLAVPLLQSHDIWPNHPCCILATSSAFAEAHPDIVQKVVDIHKRAEQWINENPANATAIAMEWLEADNATVQTAFNRIIYDYNVNKTAIGVYLEFLIDQELVSMDKSDIDSFLDVFINTTYLESPP